MHCDGNKVGERQPRPIPHCSKPSKSEVAYKRISYHEVGAIAARLLTLHDPASGGCAAPKPSGAIPEVRRQAGGQHPVRARGAAAGGLRALRDSAAEARSAAAHVRGARQHRAAVRHRPLRAISRWMPSRTTAASSSNSSRPTVGSSATCRCRARVAIRPTADSWTTPPAWNWDSPTPTSSLEPAVTGQRRLLESNGLYLSTHPSGIRLRHGAPAGEHPLRNR